MAVTLGAFQLLWVLKHLASDFNVVRIVASQRAEPCCIFVCCFIPGVYWRCYTWTVSLPWDASLMWAYMGKGSGHTTGAQFSIILVLGRPCLLSCILRSLVNHQEFTLLTVLDQPGALTRVAVTLCRMFNRPPRCHLNVWSETLNHPVFKTKTHGVTPGYSSTLWG